jgi:hypothetical protein
MMARMAAYAPPILLAALVLLVCIAFEARPSDPHKAALVFPPWWSGRASLNASTRIGEVVGLGALPFIIIVHANNADLAAQARAAGAWFVVDSANFGLCFR